MSAQGVTIEIKTVADLRAAKQVEQSLHQQIIAAKAAGTQYAHLKTQPAAVHDTPLDTLFLLTASLQAHEGAHCAGQDYRERELPATAGIVKPDGFRKAQSPNEHGGEKQGGQQDESEHPCEASGDLTAKDLPETGHQEVDGRGQVNLVAGHKGRLR